MIGSAVQNIITLTDTYFLARYDDPACFPAIGIVGIFYLMITTIGFNFTKAGQIVIARRMGEGQESSIGSIFYSMLSFISLMAVFFFFVTRYIAPAVFPSFVQDPDILRACIEYLEIRAFGIIFSYIGMVFLVLYTGIARPMIIIYNALCLGILNGLVNYALIFGNWGMPEMGMKGAAWASNIAEITAFVLFLGYMLIDKKNRILGLFGRTASAKEKAKELVLKGEKVTAESIENIKNSLPKTTVWNWEIIKNQIILSFPIVCQSVLSIGSWLVFFFFVENLSKDALEASTLLRSIYMMFMIPTWGFGASINTIVSNIIGQKQFSHVIPAINKTALLCFIMTMACTVVLLIIPDTILGILAENEQIVANTKALIPVFILILIVFCTGSIYFNGIIGAGATYQSLYILIAACLAYIPYVYLTTKVWQTSLSIAWGGEVLYWLVNTLLAIWYLRSNRWHSIKV